MIEAHGLSRSYGSFHALRDVSFAARAGRVTGLLGHNGAGKTTCIRILTGFIAPSAGRATVAQADVLADPRRARLGTGYLPESAPGYPEMRVTDALAYRASLAGVPRKARRAAVERAVERCWLTEVKRRRLGHLSKGFRQRVGLAGAIIADPPAVILDEPASGLDPAQIVETRRLIRELAHDKAVLLSSHILSEIEATCDDAVVLARGRVRASGPLAEITSGGSSVLSAELAATREQTLTLLGLAGIETPADVTVSAGWAAVRVAAPPEARERLARAAAAENAIVRELTVQAPAVERVLLDLLQPPPEDRA